MSIKTQMRRDANQASVLAVVNPPRRKPVNTNPEADPQSCEPCKTYEQLRDYCYEEWAKSEGRYNRVYVDSKGYPTTGTGQLIYHPQNGPLATQRKTFQEDFDFVDSRTGKHLTKEEKGKFFDQIVADYNARKLGNDYRKNPYPQYTLTDESIKAGFDKRFKKWYNQALRHHPDFHEMPRSLAQSMMHLYWWGKGNGANKINPSWSFERQAEEVVRYMNGSRITGARGYGIQGNRALREDAYQARADSVFVCSQRQRQVELNPRMVASRER